MSDERKFDLREVSEHNTAESCWVVINDTVYDVTEFLPQHPGGESSILSWAGKNATEEYEMIHPPGMLDTLPPGSRLGSVDSTTKNVELVKSRSTNAIEKQQSIELCLNLEDFERVAEKKLSQRAWIYYSSASGDHCSYQNNRLDWQKIAFRPRVMRNVDTVDMEQVILGKRMSLPIFIAPAALARLGHPDGELCLVKGSSLYNIPYAVSTASSVPLEELARWPGHSPKRGALWFQLYVKRQREETVELIRRAKTLGYTALVITVDTAAVAPREADDRYKVQVALEDGQTDIATPFTMPSTPEAAKPAYRAPYSSSLNWEDLSWIRAEWGGAGPIGLKGIATAEDAKIAIEYGVDFIYLSNHGGRQLDGSPSALRTLLEIREFCPEVLGNCQIFLDGGVRRGSDVIKALCLGATAVGLGRPFMFALSAYGAEGVQRAIQSKLCLYILPNIH
ncbi:L-lactate dehydrogenase, partial [Aureobasidium melanogenum]